MSATLPSQADRGAEAGAPAWPLPRPASWRWLLLLMVVVCLLVGTLSYVALHSSRKAYQSLAVDAMQNLSEGIRHALAADLDRIDTALQSFVLAHARATVEGPLDDAAMARLVEDQQRLVPDLDSLYVVGADGLLRHGPAPQADGPRSLAERPYFQQVRDAAADEVVVSEPEQDGPDGRWAVVVARQLRSADGRFDGMVHARLDMRHFERILGTVALGPRDAVTVRTASLALVARRTGTPLAQPPAIGSRNVSPELLEALQSAPQAGSYVAATALDRIERINAYRRVTPYPLMVLVGVATEDYLRSWQREVALVALLASLVVLTLGTASVFVWRAWQRAAESAARAQREAHRQRALMITASDGIHVLDRRGRVVELSDSFAQMLGYPREAMLGMHVHTWDAQIGPEHVMRTMRDFRVGERFKVVTQHRKRDGSLIDAEVVGVGVHLDGQDLLYCAARDVTARSQAERALRASRALLDRTGRVARVGGWELDMRSGQLTWSDETCRIHGMPTGSAPTLQQAMEFVDLPHRPHITAAIDQALKAGTPWDLQLGITTADGRKVWVRAVGEAETEAGSTVRLVGALQDITESEQRRNELAREQALRGELERRAAELDTLLRERSGMLDVMAHEVRQPLNNASAALQGAATALAAAGDTVATQRLARAQTVLGHVLASIDNTLAVAALLARAGPIERSDTDIDTLVAVCIGDMPPAERQRIVVDRVTTTRTASMDMSLMRLALRNLLSNALKYSPPGASVTVRLSDSDEPLALLIDVIDQGPGVPPALAQRLFERGTRGEHPAGPAGLGLGLYIVRRVMELHGGRVVLVDGHAPGHGLTMRLVVEQESGE